jgi:hypothetical protein
MIALGEVVIIGGGCYGSFYLGQLAKARAAGVATWTRLLVVDRDAQCRAATSIASVPDAELRVVEWAPFLEAWLDASARTADDRIVPSPLMPHLMASWLEARARERWPERDVRMVPAEAELGTPFDRLHPGDGVRYVSFADWLCPVHCIEPARCPAIRAPRQWEMSDAVTAWTTARRREHPTAGPALFACRHATYGVGMYAATLAFEALAALDAEVDAHAQGADLVIGSVSACHGAVGVLRVGPEPTTKA